MVLSCPVCQSAITSLPDYGHDASPQKCPRCGPYSISGAAEAMLKATPLDERQAANASGWIREHRGILVNSRDIEFLRSLRSPSVSERAEKILVEFERRLGSLGASHSFDFSDTSQMTDWAGISWSADKSEVRYLIFNYLYQFLQAID